MDILEEDKDDLIQKYGHKVGSIKGSPDISMGKGALQNKT